jgi:hypothetical protein
MKGPRLCDLEELRYRRDVAFAHTPRDRVVCNVMRSHSRATPSAQMGAQAGSVPLNYGGAYGGKLRNRVIGECGNGLSSGEAELAYRVEPVALERAISGTC